MVTEVAGLEAEQENAEKGGELSVVRREFLFRLSWMW